MVSVGENAKYSLNVPLDASLSSDAIFMDKNLPFMDKMAWKWFLRYAMDIASKASRACIAVTYTPI